MLCSYTPHTQPHDKCCITLLWCHCASGWPCQQVCRSRRPPLSFCPPSPYFYPKEALLLGRLDPSIAISSNTGFQTQIPTDISEWVQGASFSAWAHSLLLSHKPPFLIVSRIKVTTGLGRITSRHIIIVLRQLGYGGQEVKKNVWYPTGKAATLIQQLMPREKMWQLLLKRGQKSWFIGVI